MRRITVAIGAAAAAALIGGTVVFAAGSGNRDEGTCIGYAQDCGYSEQHGEYYTDSDGDGICDHYQIRTEGNVSSKIRAGACRQAGVQGRHQGAGCNRH